MTQNRVSCQMPSCRNKCHRQCVGPQGRTRAFNLDFLNVILIQSVYIFHEDKHQKFKTIKSDLLISRRPALSGDGYTWPGVSGELAGSRLGSN